MNKSAVYRIPGYRVHISICLQILVDPDPAFHTNADTFFAFVLKVVVLLTLLSLSQISADPNFLLAS